MKCENCGAVISEDQKQCPWCKVSNPEYVAPSSKERKSATQSEIFAEIRASEAWADRDNPQHLADMPTLPAVAKLLPIIVGGMFCVIPGIMALMMITFFGPMGFLMAIFPLGIGTVGVSFTVMALKRFKEFESSPIVSRPAILKGKRTHVSGGSGDSSASTVYHLTFEFEDGERIEFACLAPDLYSTTAEGDSGVLFTRSSYVIAFNRVILNN